MIEALVLAVCLEGPGCTEVATAYYKQNEELQAYVALQERSLRSTVSPLILDYAAPLAATCLGVKAAFKIASNVSFGLQRDYSELIYSKGF